MKKLAIATTEKTLKLRKRVKKRKPDFLRQESWRYTRLKENWRKPRGLDNKMRRKIKGWPPTANIGYRGPKVARGLHPSGYREILVYNTKELKEVDPKSQAIRISHTVGKRKRAQILSEARKRKIIILNPKGVKEVAKEEKEEIKETEKEGQEKAKKPKERARKQ